MNIVHVVSAFTPDNRFGGPTRVAIGLCRELIRRGHDVTILAAALDYATLPTAIDEVPADLVRGVNPTPMLGWASLLAPGLGSRLQRRLANADVVHIHLARDVVTLSSALRTKRSGVPYVVQTHGMIDAAGGGLARLVDTVSTGRALRGASAALTLTPDEQVVVGRLTHRTVPSPIFPNGLALTDAADAGDEMGDADREVLFLARLHPRKGAQAFARAALEVGDTHPNARFSIVGPDEGDRGPVEQLIAGASRSDRIALKGAVLPAEARRLLASCLVYVLPAEGEPFGMTVIEAMGGGRPVILHASSALSGPVVEAGAGWSFGPGGTHPTLAEAIAFALDHPAAVQQAGEAARALVAARYSIEGVVDTLLEQYTAAIAAADH